MRTKWYLLGCLTSVILVIVMFIWMIAGIISMSKKASPTAKLVDNSVLHLKLTGSMQAYSTISDANFKWVPQSTHDLILKINQAKTDPKIKAIILEPQFLEVGYATVNELIAALDDFKTSGKKVYGYITMALQTDILLLSAADEVYMNPSASAGFVMHGMGGSIAFFKDMLDKLGITVHIVRSGDFKSAGEQFSRSDMSPEFRSNMTTLYDDLYAQLLTDFATKYNVPEASFRYLFEGRDKYYINMDEGKDMRIVDELMFFDTFLKKIGVNDKQLVSHSKYTLTPPPIYTRGSKVAVVYMLGDITSAKAQFGSNNITSREYVKIFNKLIDDESIRAVVLRISSGGGSALESEIIHSKIAELKEKKPVVVSMGGVAASGGYYIATNANYIFADPYTVTGSIGVIGMIPDFSGTADKVGINSERVGHGKYLSVFDLFSPLDPAFEKAMQRGIVEIYDEFKSRVALGRGLSLDYVELIAQGLVWSAPKALEYGLIDQIGHLNDAIEKAVEISNAYDYNVIYYPERKTFWETLFDDQFDFLNVKALITGQLPSPIQKNTDRLLNIVETIQTEPIQMRSEIIVNGE